MPMPCHGPRDRPQQEESKREVADEADKEQEEV